MVQLAKRRIGLMGGTFDPVHYGHLFIAEEARVRCALEQVVFIPNAQPPHAEGKSSQLDAETRWELVRLATESNPYFDVSRVEVDRAGKSYSFDTITWFQNELGPETELFFIVGADSILDVGTWYRGLELLRRCTFVAASRPGYDLEAAKAALGPELRDRIVWLEVPGLHIASREIRSRVLGGQAVRYLVPDAVVEAIESQGLYAQDTARLRSRFEVGGR